MGRLRTRVERLEQLGQGGLPDQSGHAGEFLTTNGSSPSWAPVPGGGGTVTSVGVSTGTSGVGVTGSPVTGSGTIDLALGTAAASDAADFDPAGSAAAAEAAANAYTDAEIAALTFVESVTAGTGVTVDSTDPQNPVVSSPGAAKAPGANFGNGSIALSGSVVVEIARMKYGGTITGWTIIGDGSTGDVDITVSHAAFAAWPTMTTLFTASVNGAPKDSDTGLSHAFSVGDALRFEASGFANFTRCSIVLDVT